MIQRSASEGDPFRCGSGSSPLQSSGRPNYVDRSKRRHRALQLSGAESGFRYTGRRLDLETGLYFFRARFYHAQLGRFISRDPIGYVDGMSLYRGYFVPGSMDPYGLSDKIVYYTTDANGNRVAVFSDGKICYYIHIEHGIGSFKVQVPCPDHRPVDPGIDVKTYDCYGLAFRTYEYSKDLEQVKKKLAGCGKCTNGKCKPGELRCLLWVFDARIDYPVGPKDTHPFGGSKPQIGKNLFHIVCAPEGELACSKNAGGPVSPPGPCKSFAPKPSDIAELPKGGVVTINNVKETCHCCKP